MITEPSTSSGELAVGTTVVYANPALLTNITLNPGSATSSVKVYDNASAASGTIIGELVSPANGASIPHSLDSPVRGLRGLTVVVAGTGATAIINFLPTF